MEDKKKLLDEIIRHYSHRMPYPERAKSLMALRAQNAPLPESEWEILSLSLLASTSEPLFLFLTSHPEKEPQFVELTHDKRLLTFDPMKESLLREILTSARPPDVVMGAFRLTHLASILVLDILSIISFDEVTLALTHLSDAIAWTAVYLSEHKTVKEMGNPYHKSENQKPVPTKIAFFALGKWGAEELNYSSDIDLVAFYHSDGETDKGHPNQAFFDKMAQSAFEHLTSRDLTGGGFKVDFSLRPRGKDGSLTLSFPAAMQYYRTSAQFWEKQAWIKARQFYGDIHLGDEFLKEFRPVIFSEHNSSVVGEEIGRSRKKMISNLKFPEKDLKEGFGSIRDIEFAVQGLEIAYSAGREPLNERHTIKALHKLKENEIISPQDEREVSSAYKILRKTEHFAQILNLRQSHLEPSGSDDWKALDRFLGVHDSRGEVRRSRDAAGAFFQKVSGGLLHEKIPLLSEASLKEALLKAGFDDPERLAPLLAQIYRKLSGAGGIDDNRVSFIHGRLLEALTQIPRGEASLRLFLNLLPAVTSKGNDGFFNENGLSERISLCLKLTSSSDILFEFLRSFPQFVSLMDMDKIEEPCLTGFAEPSDEADIETSRLKQKEAFFSLITKEVVLGDKSFLDSYTCIAENILKMCFEKVVTRVSDEFNISKELLGSKIGLFSLGRLGFKEMMFGSDLDLLLVKDGDWVLPGDPEASHLIEKRIVSSLVDELTAITPNGSLYQVDLRLRPYGSAGVAVPSKALIFNYFSKDARPWERLSYIKLRRIARGEFFQCGDFSELNRQRQFGKDDFVSVREIIKRLHLKNAALEGSLKFGGGGLFEQDLLLLGRTLSLDKPFPTGEGCASLFSFLEEEKAFSSGEISTLKEARSFFLRSLYHLRIHGLGSKKIKSPRELPWGAWDEKEEAKLRGEITSLIESRYP
jgi:[glutamine synthetase] adenylyltransferase / [glutamine synthetase]-adenylyl-L-tyrosine phosphorylase